VLRAGAGIIETPGAEDIYSFMAVAGQKAFFRLVERGAGMDQNQWKLVDDNGMEIFNTCMGCGEPGLQTGSVPRQEQKPNCVKVYCLSYTKTLSTGLPSGPTPVWVTILVFPSRDISHFSVTSFLPFR
jgi:hypothetical protein